MYGLIDRGRLEVGWHADIVVFDPSTLAPEPVRAVNDLPAGGLRLTGGASGVDHVFVNGVEIVSHGAYTGERPGAVLRSGRSTRTVAILRMRDGHSTMNLRSDRWQSRSQRTELPRFISVDDHVVEPPGLWQERLPEEVQGRGPADGAVAGEDRLRRGGRDSPTSSWATAPATAGATSGTTRTSAHRCAGT